MRLRKSVVEYLEASARRSPEACAVVDEHESVTYAELLDRSKRVGSSLAERGAAHQGVVIVLEKSAVTLSVMMGALFAGAFYVIVEPGAPELRMRQVIARLNATLIVAEEGGTADAVAADLGIVPLRPAELLAAEVSEELLAQARTQSLETDPAYVLFTSGSTGEPKGVTISHHAIDAFVDSFVHTFGFTAQDRFANQAPFDFDVSTKDIYSALYLGATLVIVPRELFMKPVELVAFLSEHQVNVLIWAVAALGIVSAYHALEGASLDSVRMVLFSGEVMPRKHLQDWRSHLPQATFVNLYGPTEITCNCLYHILDPKRSYDEGIPLGGSFDHCTVHLLAADDTEQRTPGERGEIVVAGPSLSLGYVGMPEATNAAFVQNPLNKVFPERVYRTGDLATYSETGELFFAGRKDNQIKLQGNRIELEEVDVAFERVDGVMRCRCVFDAKRKRLRAFYEGTAERQELIDYAKEHLPFFMRPSTIERVESMPLNKHGKVDRAQLFETWQQAKRAKRAGGAR